MPRDRHDSFESVILPKHKRDVSDIENKVLAMYARGMSQRDISATIDDIYDFKLSAEQISKITDYVLEEQQSWQNRTLAPFYPFLFVDCLFVPIKRDYETKECTVYNILGIRVDGRKKILGLWIQESESKQAWMQIFDELKARGVQEVGFISMDGLSGLEEGAKAKNGLTAPLPTGRSFAINFSWTTDSLPSLIISTANFPYLHNLLDTALFANFIADKRNFAVCVILSIVNSFVMPVTNLSIT